MISIQGRMKLKEDGTFVCQLQPTGFIANTFKETLPGKIYGRWNIEGDRIMLNITGEKNEQLANDFTSSKIEAFR